jgi:ketosteroid isomerase-like protein
MTVAQDLASKWQTAYNNGDAAKVAELYMQDAVWVRPTEIDKGMAEIEKAVANSIKQFPQLTVNVAGAGQHGNVVWFYSNYMLANGPTGHSGVVLFNDGGSWRYLLHTSNITPPKQ